MKNATHLLLSTLATVLLLTSCAQPPSSANPTRPAANQPAANQPAANQMENPQPRKTLVVGITAAVEAMPMMAASTTVGGWRSAWEIFSQGLVSSEQQSRRPVPRLAAALPSVEDGTLAVLPDGRMKTVYRLRPDVTWHDGAPFTAQDLMFSYEIAKDGTIPKATVSAITQMESVEAPDDYTFVIYWKGPYYLATSIGSQAFWPLPRHILEQPYRTLERQGYFNLPYWTSGFIHLGPFRLAEFRPGEELIFSAYDGYFLGRPRVDRIIIRAYADSNTLFAATISGAVDVVMDTALISDKSIELKEVWDRSGEGTVYIGPGISWFISPQFDPAIQRQPSALDPAIRKALMYATDRGSLSEIVNAGSRDLVANAILAPTDRLYAAVRDGFAQYTFDPARATASLAQLGWTRGADGTLVDAGGRRFDTTIQSTPTSMRGVAIIADNWKQVGVIAEQMETPAALARDLVYRQSYPGFELSSSGAGDAILTRMDGRESAVPPGYAGVNRGHYVNPSLDLLIDTYRRTIDEREQGLAFKAISDVVAEELPVLPMYFDAMRPATRKGVKAFDDFAGGAEPGQLYGTYSRNAHEWDKL